jgi:LPXTG-motif cell wall-anchored protein
MANPVLSLLEDVGSAVLTLFAFVVPILAVVGVAAVLVLGLVLWRKRRRRRLASA